MEAQGYKKLVEALRWCDAGWEHDCEYCPLHLDHNLKCMEKLLSDSAAAIEELQAVLKEADKKQEYQHDCICELTAENEELKAEVDALKHDIERYVQMNTELLNDRPELEEISGKWVWKEPKRGEWIRVQEVDIPGEIHPVAFKCMCSMCRNEYLFPKIPQYCPECGSMNTAKTEVQDGKNET